MKWHKPVLIGLGLLAALCAVVPLLGLAPLVGYVALPVWFARELLSGSKHKAELKRQQQASRQRVDRLIQLHLIAHRLADTPMNRARVLQGLTRPEPRRRRR